MGEWVVWFGEQAEACLVHITTPGHRMDYEVTA